MKRRVAFTLIELLVVVAIIAILAAIAIPNFLDAQVRARVSRARTDMRTVATALESYAVDHSKYPPMLGSSTDGTGQVENERNGYGSVRLNVWRGIPHQVTTPVAYLTSLPEDVFRIGATVTQTDDNATPDVGKPYSSGNPFDMTFVYHNIVQYATAEPDGRFAGLGPDLLAYWRIYSLGPDKHFNAVETLDLTTGAFYDPTNGTVSAGEILRTQKQP